MTCDETVRVPTVPVVATLVQPATAEVLGAVNPVGAVTVISPLAKALAVLLVKTIVKEFPVELAPTDVGAIVAVPTPAVAKAGVAKSVRPPRIKAALSAPFIHTRRAKRNNTLVFRSFPN